MAEEKAAPKFDARVPLDWSSSVTRALAKDSCPPGSLGAAVLATGCSALDAITDTFSKVLDAKAALHAQATPVVFDSNYKQTSGEAGTDGRGPIVITGREAEFDRSLMVAFGRLVPKVEGSLKSMQVQREKIEAQVDAKMDRLGSKHANDVRYHFERHKLPASKAIDIITNGDEGDAMAVAGAFYEKKPSFLSPFKAEQIESIRAAARARFAPSESAQLATATRVIGQLTSSRDSFLKRFASIRPKVKKGQKADEALAALVK